jgi:hypothetical protein
MSGLSLVSRTWKHFTKQITFTGLTGAGLINENVPVATVSGRVLLHAVHGYCITDLAGATATVSLGTVGNVGELIGVTTATTIDSGEIWRSATPDVGIGPTVGDHVTSLSLVINCLTASVSAGVLEVSLLWLPMSVGGDLG